MASLNVYPTAGGASHWVLYSGELAAQNPLRSGVAYGRAPAGTLEVTGPVPLVAGTEYTVIVYRWVEGALLSAGAATFRP